MAYRYLLSPVLVRNPQTLFSFSWSLQRISKNSFHHLEEGLCHSVWVNVREMSKSYSGYLDIVSPWDFKQRTNNGFWLTSGEGVTSQSAGYRNRHFPMQFKGNDLIFIGTWSFSNSVAYVLCLRVKYSKINSVNWWHSNSHLISHMWWLK